MALRFRRSIQIVKGVKLNFGKNSVGVSMGSKHGGISVNSKTGVRGRVSIPGTGLSYSEKLSDNSENTYNSFSSENSAELPKDKPKGYRLGRTLLFILLLGSAFFTLAFFCIKAIGLGIFMLLLSVAIGRLYERMGKRAGLPQKPMLKRRWVRIIAFCSLLGLLLGFTIGGNTTPQETDAINIVQETPVVSEDVSRQTPTESVETTPGVTNNADKSVSTDLPIIADAEPSETPEVNTVDTSPTENDAEPKITTEKAEPVNDTEANGNYIASANSDKFHYLYCSYAKRIDKANAIYFTSADNAIASGYTPCGHCNPR